MLHLSIRRSSKPGHSCGSKGKSKCSLILRPFVIKFIFKSAPKSTLKMKNLIFIQLVLTFLIYYLVLMKIWALFV